MAAQKNIVSELYKDTFVVFLMSTFAASIGNVIDGMIIGKYLGSASIASFGFTNPFQKFTAIFPNVLALGMQLLVSRKLGKGELNAANGIFSLAVSVGVGLAIFFIAISFIFPAGVADLLGAEENLGVIRKGTIDYFQAYALGLPAVAAVSLLTPIMQLDGDRNRAVSSVTLLSVANVLGDLFVIFYLHGDIWEIGIVTAVAYYISAGFLILHFFKPEASFRFSPADIEVSALREMFLEGSPVALGRGASMLRSRFLNEIALTVAGGAGVAAVAIWDNIFSMVTSLPKALAQSVQLISGVLVSEQDKKSVLQLTKFATKYSLKVSLIVAVILFIAAPQIAGLYTSAEDSTVFFAVTVGIRWIAFSLVFATLGLLIQYFYQAYGRFKLVTFMAVGNNLALIVPAALILTPHFRIDAVWIAEFLNQALFVVFVILGVRIYYRRITFSFEDILLLPKDFGSPNDPRLNMTVTFKDDDLSISEVVEVFLEKHNVSRKKTMYAAICVEEIVNNILEHGFNDGKAHSIDVRVIIHGEEIILRIRDDCRAFNPKKWQEIYNDADPTAHIGIKLVSKMAKEIQYVNVLKLNSLIIKI